MLKTDSEEEQNMLSEYEVALKENESLLGKRESPNVTGRSMCRGLEVQSNDYEGAEIAHDSPEWYQLHLATEQIRIPEILFQPSIIGHDQAGISETIEFILKKFPDSIQQNLVDNIFITGALAGMPGIKARLEKDLKQMRPFKSCFNVSIAKNPSVDAWNGAKKFANIPCNDPKAFISRKKYDEMGPDYLSEHFCSNLFTPTPAEEPSEGTV